MVAMLQVAGGGVVENVVVARVGTTDQAIEVLGANVRLLHISCGTSGSSVPQIVVSGDYAYLEDVNVSSSSDCGILVTGDRAQLVGITTRDMGFATGHGVRFDASLDSTLNGHNSYQDGFGVKILNSTRIRCTNLSITDPGRTGVVLDGAQSCVVEGTIWSAGRHGLTVDDSSDNRITMTILESGGDTTNTYSNVYLETNSNRNLITGCLLRRRPTGNTTKYAVNVSASTCDCNTIVGNDFGEDYGTSALNNSGTNTRLFYPADATLGDNFSLCATS